MSSDLTMYLMALTRVIHETRGSLSEPLSNTSLIEIISKISEEALTSDNPHMKKQATFLINWLKSPKGRSSSAELILEKVHNFTLTNALWDASVENYILSNQQEAMAETKEEAKDTLERYNAANSKAFAIMPFDTSFPDVWEGAIKRACQETDYAPLRVDQISLSSFITDDIKQNLKKATIVIADITGNNPNVMFELGWAIASRKKIIIICQKGSTDKVPFDIKDIRHISYESTWSGIEALKDELKKYITSTGKKTQKKKTA